MNALQAWQRSRLSLPIDLATPEASALRACTRLWPFGIQTPATESDVTLRVMIWLNRRAVQPATTRPWTPNPVSSFTLPALLDALEEVLEHFEDHQFERARAVVARARGEPEDTAIRKFDAILKSLSAQDWDGAENAMVEVRCLLDEA